MTRKVLTILRSTVLIFGGPGQVGLTIMAWFLLSESLQSR